MVCWQVSGVIASVAAIVGFVLGSVLTYVFQVRNVRQMCEGIARLLAAKSAAAQ